MTPLTSTPPVADTGTARTLGQYAIDTARTRVEIRARYLGLPVGGVFDDVAGTIDVPSDLAAAGVAVTIDPASFHTGGGPFGTWLRAGFAADAGAVVRFEAGRMEPILESFVTHDGDRPLWALVGNLTLCGVTRPVRIAVGVVRPLDDGVAIAFSGTTVVRCSDFGVRRQGGLLSDTIRVRIIGIASRGIR